MKKLVLSISILCFVTGTIQAGTTQADIVSLGDLPGGQFFSQAQSVSADGSYVVGSSSSSSGIQAFLWCQADGMIGLGDLPGGEFGSDARDISADSLVVVGCGSGNNGPEMFRWIESGGLVGLGDLPGGEFNSCASLGPWGGVSCDGTVVVGGSSSANGNEAFRWTQNSGMIGLGDLPGGGFNSDARDISADGLVIVGRGESANGNEAFRWTEADGMVGLGDLPGGNFESRASAVSANGDVVVGRSWGLNGLEAVHWTQSGGIVGIGFLPGDHVSRGYGVSANGSVIVGTSGSTQGENVLSAFIWTTSSGMVRLFDYLADQGADLSHWMRLSEGNDISDDGRTIVGQGVNINGDDEAFVAIIKSILLVGDVNLDGVVDLLDVHPFVEILTSGGFQTEADINQDGVVDLLDVQPFVDLLIG